MTLHIFNPEHDHALAANLSNFTPPHAARQLRSELSFLPALWAETGDIVVVDDVEAACDAYRKLKLEHRPEVIFTTPDTLFRYTCDLKTVSVEPWGWDITVRNALLRAGVPCQSMPTDIVIDNIRRLSNRSLAVRLLEHLSAHHCVTGHSVVCSTYGEVVSFLHSNRNIVVKAPWSCSGRGVRYIDVDTVNRNALQWVDNTIRRQGTVVAEIKCPKVRDFAVEFMSRADGVRAVGLSLFTTVNGAYTGNMLASEEDKRSILAQYLSPGVLDSLVHEIETFLTDHIRGVYTGPLGVDMMIVANGNAADDSAPFLVNPCVEINLRRTMGHVALALSQHGHCGAMDIAYENKQYKVKLTTNNNYPYN